MAVVEQPDQSHLLVLEPEEGLRRAQPVPTADELTPVDATDEEWAAFYEAIADR